jgi:hypothetical protein
LKVITTAGDGWRPSKCSEADLQALVDEGLLQSKEVIKWCNATGDKRPYEEVDEIVLFQYFVERGLALPTSDFSVVSFFLLWNPIASSQSQLHHSHFYFCSVL